MNRINRRRFLKNGSIAAAAIAAPSIIPASALGADGVPPPSERINSAVIGRGTMSRGHLNWMLRNPEFMVRAVCDVDAVRRTRAKQEVERHYGADKPGSVYRGCDTYNDYRELLARPDIDAVFICTPDHWHALQAIDAAKAGKDIYCEKPIAISIEEGRRLVETVRRYDRVFQTGMQRRSNPILSKVCDFIRQGKLGKIKAAYTTVPLQRNYLDQKGLIPYRGKVFDLATLGESVTAFDIPLPEEPVHEGLDWDLWVGPAAWRPYNRCYHRNDFYTGPVPWNFCVDFGHGGLSNHTVHSVELIQYALGKEDSGPVEIIHPNTGEFPTLTWRYDNGALLHSIYMTGGTGQLAAYNPVPGRDRLGAMFGALFVGERGWIDAFAGATLECEPKEILDELGIEDRSIRESDHTHRENWLEAIRARKRPLCHEEIGHRSASVGNLGDIAWWLGRSLKWDPAKEEFIGDDDANRLRRRTMRAPWRI